ncbi:MAG: hypothetical protein WCT99_05920 [Bacteroidota bacterium]
MTQQHDTRERSTDVNDAAVNGLLAELIAVTDEITVCLETEEVDHIEALVEKRKALIGRLDFIHADMSGKNKGNRSAHNEEITTSLVSLHLSTKKMQSALEEKSNSVLNVLQRITKHHYYNQ